MRAGEIRRAFMAYCDQALRFCRMIRELDGCTVEMLDLAIRALDLLIAGADSALRRFEREAAARDRMGSCRRARVDP